MKKIILSLAVIFMMSSFTTANINVDKAIIEDVPGRECVDTAMEFVNAAVDAGIGDGELNGAYYDEYMTIYHFYYRECMLGFV